MGRKWTFSTSEDGCVSEHESASAYSDPNLITGLQLDDMNGDYKYMNLSPTSNGPDPTIHSKYLSESCRGDSAEEKNDFCDSVLKYINQVLMEDDMEDKAAIIQNSTLRVAETCFYEILNESVGCFYKNE